MVDIEVKSCPATISDELHDLNILEHYPRTFLSMYLKIGTVFCFLFFCFFFVFFLLVEGDRFFF